jgi:hypothetical protein
MMVVGGGPVRYPPPMQPESSPDALPAWLTLRRTRALVQGAHARALVAFIAVGYALVALVVGLMLEIGPTGVSVTTVWIYGVGSGSPAWNYPAVLVIAPGWILALPFLATISMALVSAGVGLGMAAGIVLGVRLIRARRAQGSATASTLAGMTPAMIALLTLGACCSTSAAAAAGIGAVAQASGSTYDQVLANSWYLNVFQLGVLAVALLAQEQLLTIYGTLVADGGSGAPAVASDPLRATMPIRVLRLALVVAGTLWALSGLLALVSPPSGGGSVAYSVGILLQRGVVGMTALAVGLVPGRLAAAAKLGWARSMAPWLRGTLLAVGFSVLVAVPPPLTEWGLAGWGNQVLGALGVPSQWGGASVLPATGINLLLLWVAFYGLLGGFAVVLALRPHRVFAQFPPTARGESLPGATGSAPSPTTGSTPPGVDG